MADTRRLFVPLLLALLALGAVACAQGDGAERWIEAKGVVVDAESQPVAGLALSRFWIFEGGRAKPWFEELEGDAADGASSRPTTRVQELRTDADGKFAGRIRCFGATQALLALSEDASRGGFVILERGKPNEGLVLRLAPTVRVHGSFCCSQLDKRPPWVNVTLSLMPGKRRVAACFSEEARFEMRLPPGAYDFDAHGTDVQGIRKVVALKASRPDCDLGEMDLPAAPLALLRGEVMPEWKVTAARGVALEKSRLADFRGRWLLIEFWGYW